MEALYNLLTKATQLNNIDAYSAMDKPENMDKVVELNTQSQLYDKGIDSKGVELDKIGGSYSPKTKRYKAERGQRYDHVTLSDTGEFYRSETAQMDYASGDIILQANTIKDGDDLQARWGENILGLTDESIVILKPKFTDDIIHHVREIL